VKGILWYRADIERLLDRATVQPLVDAGIDTIAYVAKDMNGEWISERELAALRDVQRTYRLRFVAWVCCMTEGYVGALTSPGVLTAFGERGWSVIDRAGRDTVRTPIACDQGLEQYACPANTAHTAYLVDGLGRLEASRLFDGFLYDFVRFPLEPAYCYCAFCERACQELFERSVRLCTTLQHFQQRSHSIKVFVEHLEQTFTHRKSFLVWPRFGGRSLARHQQYPHWQVQCLSPMLYPFFGSDPNRLLRRFAQDWSGACLPLFLLGPSPNTRELQRLDADDYLITHYGASRAIESRNPHHLRALRWRNVLVSNARYGAAWAAHRLRHIGGAATS
jgi:hypothetical protein